jgi:dTDP-4-dehydrorhamnose 3,5-epimerase
MTFTETNIPGSYIIHLAAFHDDRGAFSRLFCVHELHVINHNKSIVQVNHSVNNVKGTLRGMHFQYPPHAEIKMIRCIRGAVYDVIVDLRKDSPTFLHWYSVDLSAEANNMIYIPEGCAHGFQTLENNSELLYFHTAAYHPSSEGAIRFNDPMINIDWPLPPINVSDKDQQYPLLDNQFAGIFL